MSQTPYPPIEPGPLPPNLQNRRRVGLMVFGIIAIVIGGLLGCMAMCTPIALVAPPRPNQPTPDARSVVVAIAFYAAVAVALIWCGVGSVRRQRWSRPMMLIVAWTWLLLGVALAVMSIFTFPYMDDAIRNATPPGQPAPPPAFMWAVLAIAGCFGVIFLIIVPTAFVWFYQPDRTRVALEVEDPQPRWTDRVPLPVLGLSVGWAMAAGFALVLLPFSVLPVFHVLLTGWAAAIAILALAAACAWLAVATYRLSPAGWWGSMLLTLALTAGATVTFLRISIKEMYLAMGHSPENVELMVPYEINPLVHAGLVVVFGIIAVVYLFRLRRHFSASTPTAAA